MKQLVWTKASQMVWESGSVPAIGDEEVLLDVEAVGICGSEIEGFLGHNSLRVPPLIMGHEFCGRVVQIGSNVKRLQVGMKVAVNPLISCGTCIMCTRGKENLCETRQIIGIHRPGGFAQKVAVPASCLTPVPESINPYRIALTEPLACSLRAARKAMEGHEFSNVIVFGAGTIGLLSAKVAEILGADQIILLDTNSARLETARSVGIRHTVNPLEPNADNQIRELLGEKGADVVIDAVGFQPTREHALRLINSGGTVVNIGLGINETMLQINPTIRQEVSMVGTFCYSRQDFADALRLLISGKITEEGWSEIRGLSEGHQAFEELVQGKVANGKIMLDTSR